jgi:hypothetical protein
MGGTIESGNSYVGRSLAHAQTVHLVLSLLTLSAMIVSKLSDVDRPHHCPHRSGKHWLDLQQETGWLRETRELHQRISQRTYQWLLLCLLPKVTTYRHRLRQLNGSNQQQQTAIHAAAPRAPTPPTNNPTAVSEGAPVTPGGLWATASATPTRRSSRQSQLSDCARASNNNMLPSKLSSLSTCRMNDSLILSWLIHKPLWRVRPLFIHATW